MKKRKLLLAVSLLLVFNSWGQAGSATIKQLLRVQADALAGPAMYGRGYVKDGRMLASAYIQAKFRTYGLVPVAGSHSYVQEYSFPVNTFPGNMMLKINGRELKPGADYLVDATSAPYTAKDIRVTTVDMAGITDMQGLKKMLHQLDRSRVCVLLNTDSMCKALGVRIEEIVQRLPEGCYIIPQAKKLTWTVEGTQSAATVFYVKEDALPSSASDVSVDMQAVLVPESRNENIIAEVPGDVKDSFIAFTGHYDHLGMMGANTVFPGASDNASGMAMLLYLASYFAAQPQHYSILFIAFSGEEAGLLGSKYYTAHPTVPPGSIKFLTNIDIMGDATDGVTVVNATEYPKQFNLLQRINDRNNYLPVIKSRGKAHNSDHYYFTEAGVPSFFIYSNGGKGYYHDIYDKPGELTLNHVAGVAQLLIDFTAGLAR